MTLKLEKSDEYVYSKYLEMSIDMVSYYDKLRKHTEMFLNEMNIKFINSKDGSGNEIVDFPWFRLFMTYVRDDLIQISSLPDTKPYSFVYSMKLKYEIVERDDTSFIKIEGFPLVQISPTSQIKDCNRKFLEHFQVQ